MSGFRIRLLCLDHLHQCQSVLYNKKMVLYNKEVDHGFLFWEKRDIIRLRLLDEDLDFRFGGAREFELVISGGSALSIRGLILPV